MTPLKVMVRVRIDDRVKVMISTARENRSFPFMVSFSRSIVFSGRAIKLHAKYIFKLLICSLNQLKPV